MMNGKPNAKTPQRTDGRCESVGLAGGSARKWLTMSHDGLARYSEFELAVLRGNLGGNAGTKSRPNWGRDFLFYSEPVTYHSLP